MTHLTIDDFSGGLNLRAVPTKIQPTESVVYTNCDNESGALVSVKEGKLVPNINVANYWVYYQAGERIVSSDEDTYYREYQDKLYSITANSATITDKDNRVVPIVIHGPTNSPDIHMEDDGGNIKGTYQYCYTFYDSADGRESAPSKLSYEVTSEEGGIVSLAGLQSGEGDKIRIYRTGGTLSSFTMVTEQAMGVTGYVDDKEDWDIAGNHVLTTVASGFDPVGTKYLTLSYSMMFAAKADKVYFTEVAQPSSWREINFIDFDADITGIGATQHGLLVFTRYNTYIVTGNSPSTLSKYLISSEQGCVNGRTVQFVDNNLVWLSTDGICASSGGKVEVISRQRLGKVEITEVYNSVVYDSMYMISSVAGTLIADFRYNLAFRWIEETGYLGRYNDKAYYSKSGLLYEMFAGEQAFLQYTSGIITAGNFSEYKLFKNFYVSYSGAFKLIVTAYDRQGTKEVLNTKLPEEFTKYETKQLGTDKSYGIQLTLKGYGELHEIALSVHGREK